MNYLKIVTKDIANSANLDKKEEDMPEQNNNGNNINSEIWVNKFNEESAKRFREQILKRVEDLPAVEIPIVVYIDSYGGLVDSLAMMVETIDEVPNPVYTVCLGKAMSCGAILLSHGDRRYCGQHSSVMVHEVSHGAAGDVHDVFNDAEEGKRINAYWLGLLAKNCGIKGGYTKLRKMIKDRDGREWWMDAKAALNFGIIDEIGTPVIEPQIAFTINTHRRKL
jgi:ATP-dependent Clp protease protease subunit